jgi:hypothetical protein
MRLVSDRGKVQGLAVCNRHFFNEPDFKEVLNLERKRSQRSRKPLILMCLDISRLMKLHIVDEHFIQQRVFVTGIRETDVQGWYKRQSVVGILFTEIESASPSVRETLFYRVLTHLITGAGPAALFRTKVTFYIYPTGNEHDAVDRYDMKYHTHLAGKTTKFNLSAKIKSLVNEASNFLIY